MSHEEPRGVKRSQEEPREVRLQEESRGVKWSQEESTGVQRSQEESRGVKRSQDEIKRRVKMIPCSTKFSEFAICHQIALNKCGPRMIVEIFSLRWLLR